MRILAGDIGGTKTLLRLLDGGELIHEERFESGAYASFNDVLGAFLSDRHAAPDSACFAVAGPVLDETAEVTNLSWTLSAQHLARDFGIASVALINDFFAVARGIPLLRDGDVLSLNRGSRDPDFPIAILGAGTGLGEAILLRDANRWRVIASEGGHCDFAPTNDEQIELLRFLIKRYGHVSYERVASGHGISNIYEHLTGEVVEAATIAERAGSGDAAAMQTVGIFVDVYAAEAGNCALKVLARGGVYLAGGVGAKNQNWFTDGRFMRSFTNKGRFTAIMEEMPVDLIVNEDVGLLGAIAVASEYAPEE